MMVDKINRTSIKNVISLLFICDLITKRKLCTIRLGHTSKFIITWVTCLIKHTYTTNIPVFYYTLSHLVGSCLTEHQNLHDNSMALRNLKQCYFRLEHEYKCSFCNWLYKYFLWCLYLGSYSRKCGPGGNWDEEVTGKCEIDPEVLNEIDAEVCKNI